MSSHFHETVTTDCDDKILTCQRVVNDHRKLMKTSSTEEIVFEAVQSGIAAKSRGSNVGAGRHGPSAFTGVMPILPKPTPLLGTTTLWRILQSMKVDSSEDSTLMKMRVLPRLR